MPADASRFPEGIVIDGVITTARPVGTLVLDSVTLELFRSTNAAVATYTQVSAPGGIIADGQTLTYGTGLDVVHTADAASSNEQISQGAGAGDVQYMDAMSVLFGTGEDVDFAVNGTDLLIQQGAGTGAVRVQDSLVWSWGTGNDVIWTPNGTNVDQTGTGEVRGWGMQNVIADPGDGNPIPVTLSGSIAIETAGAETNTMAIPTYVGQQIMLYTDVYAGDRVITVASAINVANNTIMTFGVITDNIILQAIETAGVLSWQVVHNDGVALS